MITMPCLSIRQPWPWAILVLGKDVENRSWQTKFRGPILIHSGKHFRPEEIREDIMDCARMARQAGTRTPDKVALHELKEKTGGIVGVVTIVDCVRGHASPWAIPGQWHWVLAGARPIPFHPCLGRLGIFQVEYPHSLAA